MTNETQQNEPKIDAWRTYGATSDALRNAAAILRKQLPVIETSHMDISEDIHAKQEAIKYLCLAAEHIDRMHGTSDPIIMSITSSVTQEGDLYLFGVDDYGRLWQYNMPIGHYSGGWELCSPLSVPKAPHEESISC